MKNRNLQGGFAPLLIIAIIAILAIGGGAYVVSKNNAAKKVQMEDNPDTQANANADANANVNANLGVNANANAKAKSSLRSMLGVGKNQKCAFTNAVGGAISTGTYYIASDGSMRGDFTIQTKTGSQTSSMLVKGGTSYVWSGSQGSKVSSSITGTPTSDTGFDLDSPLGYNCEDWSKDDSKFAVPSSVNFVDIGAMMKLKAQ